MSEKVYLLNAIEKKNIEGKKVQEDWYFNPIIDCDNNWIISKQEVENSIYPENDWIKLLPIIEWCPVDGPPPL